MVDPGDDPDGRVSLPTHLSVTEFEEIVRDAGTLYDVQRRARVSRERARALVRALDLQEELPANDRWAWR